MTQYGNDSRAVVLVQWINENSGHVFIAEQHDSNTIFIDPQTGDKDCDWYFKNINPSAAWLIRVDTLEFTDMIKEAFRNRARGI